MRKMHGWSQLYALVMDLELRHLRCLVAIVDAGTFTDAAIELGISQAAVSRNLIALEQVLGVRLLHRTSRTVTPTTAGVHVLAQARQLLAAAGQPGGRGDHRAYPAPHRSRLVGHGPAHPRVPAPLGGRATRTSSCS